MDREDGGTQRGIFVKITSSVIMWSIIVINYVGLFEDEIPETNAESCSGKHTIGNKMFANVKKKRDCYDHKSEQCFFVLLSFVNYMSLIYSSVVDCEGLK